MTEKNSKLNLLIYIGALSTMLIMLFFAKMMYDMVNYVGHMSQNVERMSIDMHDMRNQFKQMVIEVSHIDDSVDNMSHKMNDMDYKIAKIQTSISKDIKGLNLSVDEMADNVKQMSSDMNIMRYIMGGMSQDINYGTRTFTHPRRLMKNITP